MTPALLDIFPFHAECRYAGLGDDRLHEVRERSDLATPRGAG
jgi:hypothetical protein